MLKKIAVGVLIVGVVGILAVGAYNRTLVKSQTEAAGAAGNGWQAGGREAASGDATRLESAAQGGGAGWQGGGREVAAADANLSESIAGGQGNGWQGGGREAAASESTLTEALPAADAQGLSADEAAALLFMREEEKLARDLYNALAAEWDASTFSRIAQSEQAHMDALQTLLDRYGLADPASAQVGVFMDPALQALYDKLLASGRTSLSEALKAGAAVEEVDILDLESRLLLTDNADIRQVYENLRLGSENHLRAFVRALQAQTGEVYQPQYLSPEAYQSIVGGAAGNGRQAGRGRWG